MESIKLIKKFIEQSAKGENNQNIKNRCGIRVKKFSDIESYYFGNLYKVPVFGPQGTLQHQDHAELTKAILFLFYEIKNKELNLNIDLKIDNTIEHNPILFNNIELSGDTLNTFATLLGGGDENLPLIEYILDKKVVENSDFYPKYDEKSDICGKIKAYQEIFFDFLSNQDDFYNKIFTFHKTYGNIGNFSQLPKGNSANSINIYRFQGWYDYYDKFLEELELWYNEKSNNQIFIEKMEAPSNKNYFDAFGKKEKGFENYVKFNGLECFFEKENNFKANNLIEIEKGKEAFFHWMKLEVSKKDYLDYIDNYIDKTSDIITSRSKKIIKTVQDEYGSYFK